MVDNSHTPALGVMTVVASRDQATLLPIIEQHVRLGTAGSYITWTGVWTLDSGLDSGLLVEGALMIPTLSSVAWHSTMSRSLDGDQEVIIISRSPSHSPDSDYATARNDTSARCLAGSNYQVANDS